MPTTLTQDVKVRPGRIGAGGGGVGSGGDGDPFDPGQGDAKDWPPGFTRDDAVQPEKYRIGMWVALASILMLFVALTSAYIVRQVPAWNGGVSDWVSLQMPPVLWVNTAMILMSSVTIELARRALKRGDYEKLNRWLVLTTLLGIGFLVGQLIAWRQLAAQGIYVNTHPHSSFFYLMTGVHGLHLFGGVIALIYTTVSALRLRIGIQKRAAVRVTALYWHFMDGLWVYLFLLLFFWK
ncbi:MAG TPA: cytochrome c oxidase subunit 3 [Blastocatellia bacterium]|jgi:cytochrome c oxidase subunit 3|nr:cytochrome c oxidase subunit 3 [Blastocatellia bacterium]